MRFKRTIPAVYELLNTEDDPYKILYFQNILACMVAFPLLLLGALINIIVIYLGASANPYSVITDSALFILLAFAFEFLSRIKINANLLDHLVSIVQSILLAFILIRYFNLIGPVVWSASFIMAVISLTRIKLTLLNYLSATTLGCLLYITFIIPDNTFILSSNYFVMQAISFCFFFGLATVVFYLNFNRYNNAMSQLDSITSQKEQLALLFKKLSQSEEKLSKQNIELQNYNETIKRNEEKLYFLAYYDHLTQLPNRKMIMERLHLLVNVSEIETVIFYVVFIDLDNFKKINDTMGHSYGDRYLQTIANRLKELVHPKDLLGRLGGDEFALIINRNIFREEVYAYIENLKNQLCYQIETAFSYFKVSASFGIAVFPDDGKEPYELLKSADTSMYKAKELGKNNIQFFRSDMKEAILSKIELESLLLKAYKNNEFFIEYQPQFHAINHHVRGFEALIRWNSPNFGRVAPLSFIPLAEETGLILGIGEFVLSTACKQFRELQDRYKQNISISVNVSTIQLQDRNFVNMIRNILFETRLNPNQLELEITESLFASNFDETIHILNELKSMNIKIALDDFGTGFSSINYLRRFPIDTLKIDKSFINDLSDNDSSIRIVRDIISLGHNLDAAIVAEGIENKTQLECLKRSKCDCIQGFMFGKPMGLRDVENLLTQNRNTINKTIEIFN